MALNGKVGVVDALCVGWLKALSGCYQRVIFDTSEEKFRGLELQQNDQAVEKERRSGDMSDAEGALLGRLNVFDFLKEETPLVFQGMQEEVAEQEDADQHIRTIDESISPYKLPTNPFKGKRYGIGLNIMKKMGYIEGQGLGLCGQGMKEPIEPQVMRPGTGIGASLLPSTSYSAVQNNDESSDDEEYYKDTPKKSLYQIIKELESNDVHIPDHLKQMSDERSSRPISLLKDVDMDLMTRLNEINDRIMNLKADLKMVEYEELEQQRELLRVTRQLTGCEDLRSQLSFINIDGDTPLRRLEQYRAHLADLNFGTNEETQKMIVSAIQPSITELFTLWDPWNLQDMTLLDELTLWAPLLPRIDIMDGLDYYQSLISSQWLGSISEVFSEWNVEAPNWAITVILDWEPIVSKEMMDHFISQRVFPKLAHAIESWDGLVDGPNIWIFEWIPYLGRLKDLMISTFVQRFDALLQDTSGDELFGMSAYKELRGVEQFENALENKVLPRLVFVVLNYDFSFSAPDLKLVHKLTFWKQWFDIEVFTKFVQLCLCDALLRSLFHTLNKGHGYVGIANAVRVWYEAIESLCDITEEFTKALDMINRFIDTGSLKPVHSSLTKSQVITQIIGKTTNHKPTPRGIPVHKLQVSFKDCVDDYCSQNGLICTPLKVDLSIAENMFKISRDTRDRGITGYINQDVLFIKNGDDFMPISLDTLADRVQQTH